MAYTSNTLKDLRNSILVAKTGGDFNTIQAAIDYAVATYPSRGFNNPVVITVASGEYREQIHSAQHIIIQSSAAAYDPIQGQAKATIINVGNTTGTYPLRTDPGDVYYMLGMSIITDTDNGILGRMPEGTFKNCSTWNGHFVENDENSVSQFQDCKFGSDIYGGFYLIGSTSPGSGSVLINGSKLTGNPTFTSDTHTSPDTTVKIVNTEIIGNLTVNGDWTILSENVRTYGGSGARNNFSTVGDVKITGGSMVNGIHFATAPADLLITNMSFENLEDNLIPDGETDITSAVHIIGKIQGNTMHNGFPAEIHMDNPDKFVGDSQLDGYISVKAALDSITDSDSDHRYTIKVAAGIYEEDNPLQGKEYVSLKAIGDLQTTRITALNPNEDLVVMVNLFTLDGFSFWGVVPDTNYAINQSVAGLTSITRCFFGDCANGVLLNHANASMTINDSAIYNPTATTTRGIYQLAGSLNVNTFTGALGNITSLIEISGTNSVAALNNIRSTISTLTTGISIKDLAQVDINGAKLLNMATAIELDGGSHVHLNGVRIKDATVDGVRMNDVGANSILNVQSTIVEDSVGFDFNFLSSTGLVSGTVSTSINNLNFVTGARIYGTVIDLAEDDEGVNVLGELHVGAPEKGAESVLGEGDSYTRGMMVYTATDASVFVDVSSEAKSASASTFTFTDTTLNSSIYIGSSLVNSLGSLVHYGFKSKVDTAAVLGAGNIVLEYWDGVDWIEFNGMEVDSGGGYFPHAKNYSQNVGGNHIRYSTVLLYEGWTRNDPMSLGTDYFWIRLRIISAITTAPIFEQFKLHTSRFEINSDGWIEYFGKSRPIGKLDWAFGVLEKAGGAADDRDVFLSDTLDVGMKKNRFANGKLARVGFNSVLPMDLDTSSPIMFSWQIIAETAGGQDVDWILRWGYNKDGDNVYPSSALAPTTSPTQQTYIVSHPAPAANTSKWYSTALDISNMISRRDGGFPDTIWFSISRDGIGDDYGGEIDIINISANYTKWCEGGHV